MKFEEVLQALHAKPGTSYIGLALSSDGLHLSVFTISNEAEDPEWVDIQYEGGELFHSDGEEESYALDNMPILAKALRYRLDIDLPVISGLSSEHALSALLPKLPDPDTVQEREGQSRFVAQALLQAKASGFITVIQGSDC